MTPTEAAQFVVKQISAAKDAILKNGIDNPEVYYATCQKLSSMLSIPVEMIVDMLDQMVSEDIAAVKSFEYKEKNLSQGSKYTVRTKGILLPESKSCVCFYKESETGKYNVYVVTKKELEKLLELYWEFKPECNWIDN